MKKTKVNNYKLLEGYSWYLPGIGGSILLIALMLAGSLLGSLTMSLVSLATGKLSTDATMLVTYPVMFVIPMFYALVASHRNMLFSTGVKLDSSNFGKLGGLCTALLASLATIATAIIVDPTVSLLPDMPKWLEETLKTMTNGKLWINILLVCVFAPICEEWLCRGEILRGLLYGKKMKPAWAIVISALFFAFIHLNPWQAIPAFALGCLFGYVYYKTGSLLLTMIMHCVNNGFALAMSRIPGAEEAESLTDLMPIWAVALLIVAALAILSSFILLIRHNPSPACDTLESE